MLQDLPPELIYRIMDEMMLGSPRPEARNLHFICDRKESLASLSLTCHSLRTLVAPILFQKISYTLGVDDWDNMSDASCALVKNALTQYSKSAVHVRELRITLPRWVQSSREWEAGQVRLFCDIVSALPLVEIVYLNAAARVSLDQNVFDLTVSHPSLRKLDLRDLTISFHGFPYMQIDDNSPKAADFTKVVVSNATLYAPSIEECKAWDRLFNLGVTVTRVHLCPSSSVMTGVLDITLLDITFKDLTTLVCTGTFTLGEGKIVEEFFQRHPTLLELQIDFAKFDKPSMENLEQWSIRSPLIKPLFDAFEGIEWAIEKVTLLRHSVVHAFRCSGVSLAPHGILTESMKTAISRVDEAYPELEFLRMDTFLIPLESGTAEMWPTFRGVIQSGRFSKLLHGTFFWHRTMADLDYSLWKIHSDETKLKFFKEMRALSADMAKAFPSMQRINQGVSNDLDPLVDHFNFHISRSPDGHIHLVQEHFDQDFS